MKLSRLRCYPLLLIGLLAVARAAPQTQVVYLSGTGKDDQKPWDFYCTGGRHSGVWTKIPVPSCWEQEGFGRYQYGLEARPHKSNPHPPMADDHGLYKTTFFAPLAWKSSAVRLVFEGVMTDAEVRVNGKSAGPIHQGAFYRFSYDITPLLRFGAPNLLYVDVAEKSSNKSVNAAERYGDYWNFAGIFRPVHLDILPASHIDRVAIDARADGTFTAQAYLGGVPAQSASLRVDVVDAGGTVVASSSPAPVTAAASEVTVRTRLENPKLWTAETPNLYHARFVLSSGGQALHETDVEFGFRTFEVRPNDGIYLNGVKLKLKGCCRHSFWPESGRTLSRQICYDDAKLIKGANMNAVRMSHYPPDADFLQACDELGLYVLDELGGWHGAYDTPTGRQLIGEMVRRDVNHPSILFWDNGNEGGFNRANDDQFAVWDPQHRPVLHPWTTFSNIATNHYRNYAETVQFCQGPEIFMPTEFLHGLYDGGAGSGMEDYWDVMYHSPTCAGGFIWAFLDESVARTDEGGRLDSKNDWAPDGIVGPHREKEGSYFTLRQVWCPVQVRPESSPASWMNPSRGARFAVENRYDFLNLNTCTFHWELATFPSPESGLPGHTTIAHGNLAGPNVPPHATGALTLPENLPWDRSDVLYVTAFDPSGDTLWTWSWMLPRMTAAPSEPAIPVNLKVADGQELRSGDLSLMFDPQTGRLARLARRGIVFPLTNGPRLVAFLRNQKHFVDITPESRLISLNQGREGDDITVTASYAGPLRSVVWRISRSGTVRIDYDVAFNSRPADILGVTFDFPESAVRAKRWLGGGPYHVWRNRLEGTTVDVWQDAYNDTVPGDTWIYPEFKGFFSDWKWMTLETTAGDLTFWNDQEFAPLAPNTGCFFGVYKPNDGRVNPVLPLPPLGLGIYQVIPAMGSKTSTPDLMGPHSQTPNLGSYHGSFRFTISD